MGGWTQRSGVEGALKGAILAAGLGRRMEPLTNHHLPKPMFPLGGKVPMAELWVRRFVESGITDVSMNLCVLSDSIRRHFGDGADLGASISYVEEQTPSGTLGGVCKQVLGGGIPRFEGSTVIVPSGDIVTNFGAALLEEMYDLHRRAGAAFSMVLVPVPWERRKDFGTVVLDAPESRSGEISSSGRIVDFREKDPDSPSNLNNASIYMMEVELLEALDPLRTESGVGVDDPFYDFGKHVFPAMLGRLPHVTLPRDFLLWGMQYDGEWLDVGQKRDYLRVNEKLLDGEIDVRLPYEQTPWGFLGEDVSIDPDQVTIQPPVVIGDGCVIEDGATLGPYAILGDGWTVEKRARIRNSVLWRRYPYFRDDGSEIPADDRAGVDPHRVAAGVTVEESIIVGGLLDRDLAATTVDVGEDGRVDVLPIDYVPEGPRA
ncbi:MAG: NDP-sugar synthase [bacterium]|nr:NDP-sugar synthase [bacterium]